MADIKDALKKFIEEQKYKKAVEEVQREGRNDEDRSSVIKGISEDLVKALTPILQELPKSAQINKDMVREAFTEAINVNMPNVEIPEISIPEIKIDTSELQGIAERIERAVSAINMQAPVVNIPESKMEFPSRFEVNMPDVDSKRPLPVMMMGLDGKPMSFSMGAGGGGKADFITIKDIRTSSGASVIDQDTGAMKITGDIQVTAQAGTTISLINRDGEYYNGDNPMPVTFSAASIQPVSQVSGHEWSTVVNQIFGTIGTNVVNPDGRFKVELPSGSSGLTDTELRATAVPVSQVSGANFSVSVTDIFGSTGTGFYNLDNRIRVELPSFTQAISVTDIFATTATSNVVNADNRVKVELPAQTVTVSSITASTATNIVDSTGVAYSGSNPVPITVISGALTSTIVVGSVVGDAVDDGSAPVQIGGIARTANPTAVAANDVVKATMDDLGRQITRPIQVRDLIQTAYVSVTGGTETTLLAASAGSFHDLIMIVGSNASDAAVSVDIRAVTAGNIVNTLRIPANGTAGWTPPVPWPQDATGNNWTVDGPDETGRTLTFSALFSREI